MIVMTMGDAKSDINNLRILLVEDDLVSQFLTKETLQGWNESIRVDVADNGIQALDKLKNSNYDVVLMDIQMPGMDGQEATRIIRTEFPLESRNIPIIAMTGQASFQIEKYDMNAFISKPFEAETLFSAIEKVIIGHKTKI